MRPEEGSLIIPEVGLSANIDVGVLRRLAGKSRRAVIPRIIHQIWLGDQTRCPHQMMRSWQEKHADWQYLLWTEANLPELVCQQQFDQMRELPGKADILRYEVLFTYGGIYVDADSLCLNQLDDFFLDNDSFCCWENEYVRTGVMSNGYLGACKENELMKALRETISTMDRVQYGTLSASDITGPGLLTSIVQQIRYNKLRIYPSHYFIPKHYTGLEYQGKEKIYAMQYWASTISSSKVFGISY